MSCAPRRGVARCVSRTLWQGGAHLWHDGDALAVNGAQVGVVKEADQVAFGRLLQRIHRHRRKAHLRLKLVRELFYQTLKRLPRDQEIGRFLVFSYLAERHRAGAVAVGLFHSAQRRRALACHALDRQQLPRRLSARRLARRLLGARHRAMGSAANLKSLWYVCDRLSDIPRGGNCIKQPSLPACRHERRLRHRGELAV